MTENTSSFNVFPVFFRGKTGGFGGCVGWKSVRAITHWGGQGKSPRKRRAASSGRNRGQKWRRGLARHFFKTERDNPKQHRDPAP